MILVVRGSADDKSRIFPKALTKYGLKAEEMFVVNARDGQTAWYYTLNPRLDRLSDGVLFRLTGKIVDAHKYFGLYRFALRVGTDPVRTALEIY